MHILYNNYLRRRCHRVICVKCGSKVGIKTYQKHLNRAHHLTISQLCIWCLQYKWNRSAGPQYKHKYECLLARIKADNVDDADVEAAAPLVLDVGKVYPATSADRPLYIEAPSPLVPSSKSEVVSDMNDITAALPYDGPSLTKYSSDPGGTDLWANNKTVNNWMNVCKKKNTRATEGRTCSFHVSFYENLGADYTEAEKEPIFDPEYNLFSKFVCEFSEYCYDHWSVRGSAWLSFVELWEAELKAMCTLLPYWCCCDGGRQQHRHMIARYLKVDGEKVKSVWKKISNEEKKKLQAKFRKPITTRMHLINAITYVSNKASQCKSLTETFDSINDFYNQNSYHGFKVWTKDQRKRGNCHFNIACPTPPFTELFLSLLYEGGIQKWLMGKYGNVNLETLAASVERIDGKWQILVKHLIKERGIVVPLRRQLEFTLSAGIGAGISVAVAGVLYLGPGTKVYLKMNAELIKLDHKSWNQYQLGRGNAMMDNVSESLFLLGKKQQEIMNILHVQVAEKDRIIREKDIEIMRKDEEWQSILKEKDRQMMQALDEKDKQVERALRDKDKFTEEIVRKCLNNNAYFAHIYTN